MTFSFVRVRAMAALGALALLAGVLAPQTQTPALATDCTPLEPDLTADPVQVHNRGHLLWLSEGPANNRWTLDYIQTSPIDLTGCSWTPIAMGERARLTGTYDGGGFTITGLKVDAPSDNNVGMFASTGGFAVLKNIRLVGVDVTGGDAVGGLVGFNGGRVVDSSVSGSVTGTDAVGGLVGFNSNEIERSSAMITVNGVTKVGGLVGDNDGSIKDSSASGSVTGTDAVGGLVGDESEESSTVERSFATGTVVGDDEVGGLAGAVDPICANIEFTEGDSDDGGGGGAGAGACSIRDSFWDSVVGGVPSAGGYDEDGRGIDDVDLKSFATFDDAGWPIVEGWGEFDASDDRVWGICAGVNEGHPFHLWRFASDPCPTRTSPSTTTAPSTTAPSTPVLAGGVAPGLAPGAAEWQRADGAKVPLVASSPAPNQVRYEADGVRLTLNGAAGTDATRGMVANPAGEVECEICLALEAGQVIEMWMFSTPRLIAAWRIEDLPCQTFTIPVVAPLDGGGPVSAGAHTLQLALPTAEGMQAVNVGVTVGGPVPASVPAGEGPVVPVGLLALTLLAAAGAMVAVRLQVEAG